MDNIIQAIGDFLSTGKPATVVSQENWLTVNLYDR